MMMPRWTWLCVLQVACWGGTATPDQPTPLVVSNETPNVVFLSLDTVRADRLGAYGYDKAKTETLDAMASLGRRYARAYSPLPLTIPTHATLFTGLYPPRHGIRSNGSGMLGDEFVTLAEHFQAAGYHTGASVSAFVTTEIWGFAQGFDAYYDDIPEGGDNFWHGERRGDRVVDDALHWARSIEDDRPAFLWVHLYDAHFPYVPPEDYLARTEGRPYDAEIAYVDDQVERLVEHFDGRPTVWVIVSDHGEGLGEHHELTHGLYSYDTTQHVLFLMYGAGIEAEVVEQPVSLADVAPTLLEHVGLPVPEGMDGQRVPSSESRPVYMESYQLTTRFQLAPHLAVVDGPLKLVATPQPELYDVVADPGETNNLADSRPEDVARLRAKLDALGFQPPGEAATPLSADVEQQLAALGYVEGTMPAMDAVLEDHKDHIDMVVAVQRADRQQQLGKPEVSLAVLEALVEKYPHVLEFRTRMSGILRQLGREEEAREILREAADLGSTPQLRMAEAAALADEGNVAEAAEMFRQLAEEISFTPRVHAMAVMSTRRADGLQAALTLGRKYRASHPDSASLAGALGVVVAETGDMEEALPLLRRGLEASTPEMDVAYVMAMRAVAEGTTEEAKRLLTLEMEHHPGNIKAAFPLSRMYMSASAWDEQVDLATRVLAVHPNDPVMWHAKVLGLFNLTRYDEARAAVDQGLAADPSHPDLILMDANIMAKEGRMKEGKARFQAAQAARAARLQALERAQLEADAAEFGLEVDKSAWAPAPEAAEGQ